MLASPATVTSTSQLTFEVQITTQIPTDGKLVLGFSQGFDLYESASISCSNVYALESLTSCDRDTTTQLTLHNAKSSDYLVIFTVDGVQLPDYVSSFFVSVTSYNAAGAQLETAGPTAFTISTSPDSLTVQLDPVSNVVGEYTDLQITLSSAQQVDSSGWIDMKLPKWNAGTQQMSLAVPFFETSMLGIVPSGGYSVPCTTAAHPAMTCIFTVNVPSTSADISQTYDVLRISQFSKDFTDLTLSTSSSLFRNPPSTKILNTFSASTYLSNGLLVTSVSKISLKVT